MKSLIAYDSVFGNTEKVARAVAKELKGKAVLVRDAGKNDVENAELVVLGTPVHGGRASEAMQGFISRVPEGVWKGKRVAVFDTRFDFEKVNPALRLLMKTIGYAAPKMARSLEQKGAELVSEPKGFFVDGKEGPLDKGALKRARKWAGAFRD